MKKIIFLTILLLFLWIYFWYPPYYKLQGIDDSYFDINKFETDNNQLNWEEVFNDFLIYIDKNKDIVEYFANLYKELDFKSSDVRSQLKEQISWWNQNEFKNMLDKANIIKQVYILFITELSQKDYISTLYDWAIEKNWFVYWDYLSNYHLWNRFMLYLLLNDIEYQNKEVSFVFNLILDKIENDLFIINNSDYSYSWLLVNKLILQEDIEFIDKILIDKLNKTQKSELLDILSESIEVDKINIYKNTYQIEKRKNLRHKRSFFQNFIYSQNETQNLLMIKYYNYINWNNKYEIKSNYYNKLWRAMYMNSSNILDSYMNDLSELKLSKDNLIEKFKK